MPGRFFLTATVAELAGHFDADAAGIAETGPRLDAGPGQMVPAVVAGRRLVAMRWGLIPMGRTNARGRPVLDTIVNARSETLFSKSAYADLGRCLMPVSGWYEWTGTPRRKTRWAIRAPGGAEVPSLATVTCAPNAEVASVHDRMPVILGPEDWAVWLGEAAGDAAAALRPLPEGALTVERAPVPA